MIGSRSLGGGLELYQVIEFHGPTHDAQWMLPGLEASTLEANAGWLSPDFWMGRTNRLVFTFQMWILRASDRVVVIDTGVGNGKQRVAPSQNMLNTPALDWLRAIGAGPEDVTDVVMTHLHGDHVGWNTHMVNGRWEPTFPKATYHIPRGDWESYGQRIARGALPQVFAAPMIDSVIPIVEAGLARFIEGGDEAAGLRAHDAPGHTPGNLYLSLEHRGETFLFSGDVIHSPVQILQPAINSRWCEFQDVARTSRAQLLRHAAATGGTIIPAHAKGLAGWRVTERGDGFALDLAGK